MSHQDQDDIRARLTVEVRHETLTVADSDGGRWWPSAEAIDEIEASADPEARVVEMAITEPMRGAWSS